MAQHTSMLDLVRQAIRQQTVSVGAVVTNLTGATPGQIDATTLAASQRWAHAVIPANGLLDLEQVYASWQTSETPTFTTLIPQAGLAGSVYFIDPSPACHLVVAGVSIGSGSVTFPLTIECGSTQAAWAVYVDGTLIRRGSGVGTVPMALTEGAHMIELILYTVSALITVPATLALTAEAVLVNAPALLSVTTTAADSITGATSCNISWVNDPKVGGVRILRRSMRPVGVIATVSAVNADRTFEVAFNGSITTLPSGEVAFHPGEEFYTRYDLIGGLVSFADVDGKSRFFLRLAPDQSAPPDVLVGQMVWAGAWREVGRQGRSVAGGTATFEDRTVVYGARYDYALQAWSVWNPNLWSRYSGSLSVRAGDLDPPGCIQVVGASANGGVLMFKYKTPADEDYAGANIYATLTRYGIVKEAGFGQLTIELNPDDPLIDGQLNNWTIEVDEQLRTVQTQDDAGVIIFNSAIATLPLPGDVVTFTLRSKVATDFGLPNSDDSVSVPLPQTVATFEFRSFDRSRNEQDDDDIQLCPDAIYVFNPAEFNRPVVFLDELTPVQQANFEAPYNDHRKYSIVLIGARDVQQQTLGVTITVEPKAGGARSFPADAAPDFKLLSENPPVQKVQEPFITDTYTSRYFALQRTIDINWIVVSAVDGEGNRSREYYFATSAPFVRVPEVSIAPSETATEAVLDVWIKDPDDRLDSVQFSHAIGDAAFSSYVTVADPVETIGGELTYRYQYRQPLNPGQVTKIAYRVTAMLADASIGQVAQGLVPFTLGRSPALPVVTATFDADDTLILQFAGDSDTRSFQWYVLEGVREGAGGLEAQRTIGGPWLPLPTQAELVTLFADRNLTEEANGSFFEFDTGLLLSTGKSVWVAARSSNLSLDALDWPGVVSQDPNGAPIFTTQVFTRSGAYIAPKIQEVLSETETDGRYFATLTVTVQDPQGRLRSGNGVVFRRMPGDDPLTWDSADLALWYQPGESSAIPGDDLYEYTATVELFEGKLSKIAYAVIGEDEQGDDDAVLQVRTIQCGIGSVPAIPNVAGVVDALGRFALVLNGDSDTVGFRYGFAVGTPESPPAQPAPSTVATNTLQPGRVIQTNTLATLAPRGLVAVTVIAYNRDDVGSEPFQHVWSRETIYVMPDVEEIVDETTDFIDGQQQAYGVLQLRITDPQNRVELVEFSGMSGNNPELWDRDFDGTDWVTVWNPAGTVTPETGSTTRYLYQVLMVPDHLSRIQYRIRGTKADGSTGVLLQSSVAFDQDAKPNVLELNGHIDADGHYWPTFRGDSDCRSWVLAVRVGSPSDSASAFPTITDIESPSYPLRKVYLPPTEEGSLREYPDPDGSPAPEVFTDSDGDPVLVQPGRMLFVTAMAFATNDGGAPNANYKSQLARFAALRAAPYTPPQVRLETSETATTGTLRLYIKDPNALLVGTGAGVYFRKMPGRESSWESGYSVYSPAATVADEVRYDATVTLPDIGAKIGYQVRGKLADGTVGVVQNDIITFSPSAVPGAPVVQLLTDATGHVRALVSADSDTTHLKVVFSNVSAPAESVVDAATSIPVTAGHTVVDWGTVVAPRDQIFVGVKAVNQNAAGNPTSPLVAISGEASTVYKRPTVRETATETDKIGTLVLQFSDDQHWLRTITLKRQSGTGTWTSRTVSIDEFTPTVTETVDLVARKTSRIQYELNGVREDGTNGLITTALVSFNPGATPDVPDLHAFTTANGQLIVEVVGDSDTQGARIAVRKAATALIKSDVLGGTNPSGILRTVQGGSRILRWTVPTADFDLDPGDVVSIGAVAYPDSACSDDTLSSEVATLVVTRTSAYLPPVLELTPSETATLATLSVQLTDPQLHTEAIEAQTKAARGAWSVWQTVWTRGVSTATSASVNVQVALSEGVPSFIRVRALGIRGDGTEGTLDDQTMGFASGTTPSIPTIQAEVTPSGQVNATFLGDSDTGSFKYGVQAISATANTATVAAAAAALTLGSTSTGRVARLTNLGSATGSNGLLIVVQAASGSGGLGELSVDRAFLVAQPPVTGLQGVINTLARVVSQDASNVTVTVTADNSAQIKLVSIPTISIVSGASVGTWVSSPASWTFSRALTAYGTVEFEGGNISGYGATRDVLTIAPVKDVGKPIITLTARIVSTNFSAGTITYGITVKDSSDPSSSSGQSFWLTTSADGLPSFTGTTLSTVAGVEQNVPVNMPTSGTSPGLLRVRGYTTGDTYVEDVALLTVPALSALPRPTFSEATSEDNGGTVGTLVVRSNDPYNQIGTFETRARNATLAPDQWNGGGDGWSTGAATVATVTNGKTYTRTANTAPRALGVVEWRATLTGDSAPFAGGSVRFSPGRVPIAPDVTVTCNKDGSFNVEMIGDSDTANFKYAWSLAGPSATPTPSTTVAVGSGNRVRLTNQGGAGYVALGGTIVVAVLGLNNASSPVEGPITYGMATRDDSASGDKAQTITGGAFNVATSDPAVVAAVQRGTDGTISWNAGTLFAGNVQFTAALTIPFNATITAIGMYCKGSVVGRFYAVGPGFPPIQVDSLSSPSGSYANYETSVSVGAGAANTSKSFAWLEFQSADAGVQSFYVKYTVPSLQYSL